MLGIMKRLLPVLALLATPFPPAHADSAVTHVTVYGKDACPKGGKDEIVVCAHEPESERYRIPKNLREAPLISPEREAWAKRAESTLAAGKAGTGSCTAIGAGGWTGCWAEQMRAAKAERNQAAQENTRGLDE